MSPTPDTDAASQTPMTKEAFAYQRLKEVIIAGDVPVGSRLVGRLVAEDLGISQIPVREAVKRLAAEGLVRIEAHVGAFVTNLPIQAQLEYLEIRLALEELAVVRVTRSGDADLSEAYACLDRLDACIVAEDWVGCSDMNRAFHRAIYTTCGSPPLVEEIDRLFALTELGQKLHTWNAAKAAESQRDHRALLAAIEAGDEELARSLMRQHRQTAIDFLAGLANAVPEKEEPGDVAVTQ
jgi:DNA-binding GntR family transcriptional regulator